MWRPGASGIVADHSSPSGMRCKGVARPFQRLKSPTNDTLRADLLANTNCCAIGAASVEAFVTGCSADEPDEAAAATAGSETRGDRASRSTNPSTKAAAIPAAIPVATHAQGERDVTAG